jgi:DNA (cytosine-5)-methyltransferase 1
MVTCLDRKKKVLSLFSGCGGMDIGFEGGFKIHKALHQDHFNILKNGKLAATSFETVFANDIRPCAKIAWNNYYKPNSEIYHLGSIIDIVKAAENKEFEFPYCDIVTGGFPCQDFSVAGKRQGFDSNKSDLGIIDFNTPTDENRGKLYMWMRKVIELTDAKLFVAENVKGLVSLGEAKKIISNDFSSVGEGFYVFPPTILKASDYGIPQTRERIFFIGINKKYVDKQLLKKIEKDPSNLKWNPYPSPPKIKKKLQKLLADLPEPEESKDASHRAYSKAKWYGKHCQGQTEVDLKGYAPTIRSEHHGNIEFRRLSVINGGKYQNEFELGKKQRRLSVRECARIQTFPDDYEFVFKSIYGTVSGSEAYKLIGNAVPPLLAYQLACRIESVWETIFNL